MRYKVSAFSLQLMFDMFSVYTANQCNKFFVSYRQLNYGNAGYIMFMYAN